MCISGLSRVFPCTRAKRSIPAGSGCAPETEFQFSGIPRGQGRSRRSGPHQFAIGPSIQLYLKPLIRPKNTTILDLDDTRSRFLVLETGYRYLTAPGAAPENRMLTAVTFNLPLAAGIRLSDRNRADLDWKNGIFTWRYRNNVTRTNFCDPLRSLHPVCRRRALLREPVWQMEYHCSLCGFSLPCAKTCAIQLLLRAREQHRQTPKPAGECGGAGSLCLLFSRKAVNLAVLSSGPRAVTFDNYPLLRLDANITVSISLRAPTERGAGVRLVVQKEGWASEGVT